MSKPSGNRAGLFIAGLSMCLLIPQIVLAEFTAEDKKSAVDAVTAYLKDVGETKAAEIWVENWTSGTYSFGAIKDDAEVVPFLAYIPQCIRTGGAPVARTFLLPMPLAQEISWQKKQILVPLSGGQLQTYKEE